MSDGGVGVQTVAALQPSTTVDFSVLVPLLGAPIEGSAHVIWVTRGGQAGLRFAQLPEVARQRTAEWMRAIATQQENGSGTDSAQQTQAASSGWSASTQPQPEVQEGTPAPITSGEWAQVLSGRGPGPVTPESNGDTMGTSSPSAASDPVGPFPLSGE